MRDTREDLPLRKVSYKTNRGNWDGVGYFHQWVSLGYKDLDHLYAVVEKEDGSIVLVEPHKLMFVVEKKGE